MAAAQPFALGPAEGRVIDLGDFGMTAKASEPETAGVVSVLEATEPPGFGSPIGSFDDLAAALRRDDVGDDDLDTIAGAHAIEIVGPPSEPYV
jgi:hypothetical protein